MLSLPLRSKIATVGSFVDADQRFYHVKETFLVRITCTTHGGQMITIELIHSEFGHYQTSWSVLIWFESRTSDKKEEENINISM